MGKILDYPRPCDCNNISSCSHCYVNDAVTWILKKTCFQNWDEKHDEFFQPKNHLFFEESLQLKRIGPNRYVHLYENQDGWIYELRSLPYFCVRENELYWDVDECVISMNKKQKDELIGRFANEYLGKMDYMNLEKHNYLSSLGKDYFFLQ